jgi:hypothetical protein
MSARFTRIALALSTLAALLALAPLAGAADTPISLGEAYRQIKDAEKGFPIPTPVATTSMGTFDAATGTFDGIAVETEIFNGKPVRTVPQITVNAVNSRLTFVLVNNTKSVRLSVTGGGTAFASAGRTSIAIDVGRLHDVHWTMTSGLKTHRDELKINRPRIIGAGAFTIPALPVAVVYDPPQDPAGTNAVTYTRATSIGTTLGLSVRSASSTSAPAVNPDFSAVGIFQDQLAATIKFAKLVGASGVATKLDIIGGVLGKAKRNVTTSDDTTLSNKLTYAFTESHTCQTDSGLVHQGPGHGDRVAYLRNVRLVWLDNGFTTFVQVLGYDSFECPSIDQLASGVSGLSTAAAKPLIDLDPFTGALGPKAPLGSDPRYVSLPGIGLLPGLVQSATYTQQLLIQHGGVSTSTKVVTDDLGAGLLSLVGLAPSQTGQVSSTLSVSNIAETTETTTVTTTLTARTLVAGQRTELAVFYDRVFGTVAFKDASL